VQPPGAAWLLRVCHVAAGGLATTLGSPVMANEEMVVGQGRRHGFPMQVRRYAPFICRPYLL